ncbi:MAG: sulfite exporter TauE/SafE family protein [Planctomycetes bacterium]|nr:sulfite exporter TauE/SafE family protein [Planctomycetota bacterium]
MAVPQSSTLDSPQAAALPEVVEPQVVKPNYTVAAISALVAGVLSTMLGVGGGIVVVPALTMFARVPIKRAAGNSLAFIFCVSAVSVTALFLSPQRHEIHLDVALVLAAGSVPGSLLGRWLNVRVPVRLFTYCFCFMLGLAAWRLLFPTLGVSLHLSTSLDLTHLPSVLYLLGVGLLAGIAAAMLGPGGGVVVVPALAIGFDLFGERFKTATATSLAMILPVSLFSATLHARAKNIDFKLVAIMVPFGIASAIGGIFLREVVDGDILRKIFAAVMIAALVGLVVQVNKKKA